MSAQAHLTDCFAQCRAMVSYGILTHLCVWAWTHNLWRGDSSQLWTPAEMNDWCTDYLQNCHIYNNALWGVRIHKLFVFCRLMKNLDLLKNFIFNAMHYTFAEGLYIDNRRGEDIFASYDNLIHFGRPPNMRKIAVKQPILLKDLVNEMGFGPNSVAHCLSLEGLIQFGNNFNNSQWIATNLTAV